MQLQTKPLQNLPYLLPIQGHKMKKLLLLFILVIPNILVGHEGGHYHKGDLLKVWKLNNGESIEGNFFRGNDHEIILEQRNGSLVQVPLDRLQKYDFKIAKIKIQKYQQIHSNYSVYFPTQKSNPNYNFYLLLSCLLVLIISLTIAKNSYQLISGLSFLFIMLVYACKTDPGLTQTSSPTSTASSLPKTSLGYLDSAFYPYKKTVSTANDGTYYFVNSNGIPEHNMMIGITSWQQQVPIPQNYSGSNHWSIPLQPVYESNPLSTKTNFMKGAVAIAVNGIPIFNALNNRGEDSFAIGELDQWGGHCGRADDYHYHAAPLHLTSVSGLNPIAFALDGFPVLGPKEPDGSDMKNLDANHGHAYGNSYHYHGTTDYPYVIGSMRGKVTTDPTTPAPENQILPQAFANSVRPALTALKGASIINFEQINTTTYLLTYLLNNKKCTVKYSWVGNNYTFVFTDGNGVSTTENYVRK
jgi:hypothetical protein